MKNLITDIEGILVGCAEDQNFSTGVTVLSGPNPFTAAVDVRGGGAGTRETEILKLESSIGRVDAIVLSGGSAFGLDASSEVQKLLLEEGKGYKVKDHSIPLVSSAVIFDLIQSDDYWENNVSIWRILANEAYKNLSDNFSLGSKGAGYGANTATVKGGQGSASSEVELSNGKKIKVGSLVINNAVGNPLLNDGPNFLSGHLEVNDEFGGLALSDQKYDGKIRAKRISNDFEQLNTVIGIIATDAPLNRLQLKRMSIMCHGSISRSIHPSHTPMDGDTIFAISTSDKSNDVSEEISKLDLTIISSIASDTFSRACNRAIFEAKNIGGKPSWKDIFEN